MVYWCARCPAYWRWCDPARCIQVAPNEIDLIVIWLGVHKSQSESFGFCPIYYMNKLVSRTAYSYTLADLKIHLSIGHSELDTFIADQVEVAVGIIESELGIACRAITWQWITDSIYDYRLPYQPISSISSITYWLNGSSTTAVANTDYKLLADGTVKWLTSPSVDDRNDAVTYQYVQLASVKTAEIKRAVFAIVGLLLNHREAGAEQLYGTSSFFVLDRILNTLREATYV